MELDAESQKMLDEIMNGLVPYEEAYPPEQPAVQEEELEVDPSIFDKTPEEIEREWEETKSRRAHMRPKTQPIQQKNEPESQPQPSKVQPEPEQPNQTPQPVQSNMQPAAQQQEDEAWSLAEYFPNPLPAEWPQPPAPVAPRSPTAAAKSEQQSPKPGNSPDEPKTDANSDVCSELNSNSNSSTNHAEACPEDTVHRNINEQIREAEKTKQARAQTKQAALAHLPEMKQASTVIPETQPATAAASLPEILDYRKIPQEKILAELVKGMTVANKDVMQYVYSKEVGVISQARIERLSPPSSASSEHPVLSEYLKAGNWAEALFSENKTVREKAMLMYARSTTRSNSEYIYLLLLRGLDELCLKEIQGFDEADMFDLLCGWQLVVRGAITGRCPKVLLELAKFFLANEMEEEGAVVMFLGQESMDLNISSIVPTDVPFSVLRILLMFSAYFGVPLPLIDAETQYLRALKVSNEKKCHALYSQVKDKYEKWQRADLEQEFGIKPSPWGLSGIIRAVDQGITRMVGEEGEGAAQRESEPPVPEPKSSPVPASVPMYPSKKKPVITPPLPKQELPKVAMPKPAPQPSPGSPPAAKPSIPMNIVEEEFETVIPMPDTVLDLERTADQAPEPEKTQKDLPVSAPAAEKAPDLADAEKTVPALPAAPLPPSMPVRPPVPPAASISKPGNKLPPFSPERRPPAPRPAPTTSTASISAPRQPEEYRDLTKENPFVPPEEDEEEEYDDNTDFKKLFSDKNRYMNLGDQKEKKGWISLLPGAATIGAFIKKLITKEDIPVVELSENTTFVYDKKKMNWITVDATTYKPIKIRVTQGRDDDDTSRAPGESTRESRHTPMPLPIITGKMPKKGPDGRLDFGPPQGTSLEARYGKSKIPESGILKLSGPTTFRKPPMGYGGKNVKILVPKMENPLEPSNTSTVEKKQEPESTTDHSAAQ